MSLSTAFIRWAFLAYVPSALIALGCWATPPFFQVLGISISVGLLGAGIVGLRQARKARRW